MASNGSLSVDSTVDNASSGSAGGTSTAAESTSDSGAAGETKATAEKSSDAESGSAKQADAKSDGSKDSSSTSSPAKSAASTSKTTTANASGAKTNAAGAKNNSTTAKADGTSSKTAEGGQAKTTSSANTPASAVASKSETQTTAQTAKSDASSPAAKTANAANASGTKTTASSEGKTATGSSSSSATTAVKAAPVSVATAKATLSDNMTSVKAGSNGVETLKSSLADAAIKTGVPAAEAAKASDSFAQILVTKLAAGLPMSVATAQAQNAFNSAISTPVATTPQAVAANSLAGASTASSLTALSGTTSNAGSAAFEASLSASLANGSSMEQAIKIAQGSAQQSEAAAKIDNSPRGGLVNGSASTLTDTSPAFQNSLSNALAKGMSPEQALQHATTAANESSAAAKADANNPKTALSSGNDEFAKTIPAGDFSKSLSAALGRGISMDQAMKSAAQSEAVKQQGIEMDAKSSTAGFANGKPPEMQSSPEFDGAVKSAMAHGATPENAVKVATQTVKNLPKEVSTPTNSLATGKNIDTLTSSHGKVFENVLGSALASGMPIDVAIAKAERAESAGKAPENKNNTTISPNKN